jgi:hypothetical protein
MSTQFWNEHERQEQESMEYIKMNLKPCIQHFIWNEWRRDDPAAQDENVRARGWTWYDMLFTAFLINNLRYAYWDHDLYMKHLQEWFRSLSVNKVFEHDFEVPQRVKSAEKILEELKCSILFHNGSTKFWFFGDEGKYNKKYKLFCLCLSYIAHSDCKKLGDFYGNWKQKVVGSWEDIDYSELHRGFVHSADASREFVDRAELFFKSNVGTMLLEEYAGLPLNTYLVDTDPHFSSH